MSPRTMNASFACLILGPEAQVVVAILKVRPEKLVLGAGDRRKMRNLVQVERSVLQRVFDDRLIDDKTVPPRDCCEEVGEIRPEVSSICTSTL